MNKWEGGDRTARKALDHNRTIPLQGVVESADDRISRAWQRLAADVKIQVGCVFHIFLEGVQVRGDLSCFRAEAMVLVEQFEIAVAVAALFRHGVAEAAAERDEIFILRDLPILFRNSQVQVRQVLCLMAE